MHDVLLICPRSLKKSGLLLPLNVFPFQFLIVETIVIICHHIYHIGLHRYLDNAIVIQQMRQTTFWPFLLLF